MSSSVMKRLCHGLYYYIRESYVLVFIRLPTEAHPRPNLTVKIIAAIPHFQSVVMMASRARPVDFKPSFLSYQVTFRVRPESNTLLVLNRTKKAGKGNYLMGPGSDHHHKYQ